MQAGETETLPLRVEESYLLTRPVEACVAWSVEPQEGASITQDGELAIDPSVSHGSIFTVTADIENGRRLITLDVYIYDLAVNPLVRGWREKSQITCGSREEVPPSEPVVSLVFYAYGRITVTWHAIETYVNYAATYAASKDGSIELTMSTFCSPLAPADFDGLGAYSIDPAGDLMLRDVWLGSPEGATGIAKCGHRFVRS